MALIKKLKLVALAGIAIDTVKREMRKTSIGLGSFPKKVMNSKIKIKEIALNVGIEPPVIKK